MNQNIEEAVRIETAQLPWQTSATVGVERKLLAAGDGPSGHLTALIRLAAGAVWLPPREDWGLELFVLDGECEHGEYQLSAGDYLHLPAARVRPATTRSGCIFFVEAGPLEEGDVEPTCVRTRSQPWLPGHGNLTVMPLHAFGGSSSALVHWPAGERFLPHQHWGGEEILVLSGTFLDEHGHYPTGSWLRSPHLSTHHPFVEQETVILVKVGHLPTTCTR